MTIDQIIDTINLIIDGRTIVGRVYITREPGTKTYEVRAFLMNKDGIGRKDTLLAGFDSAVTAIQVRNELQLA